MKNLGLGYGYGNEKDFMVSHIVCNANLIVQQCYDDCDLYAWRLCAAHAFLKTGVSARWGD